MAVVVTVVTVLLLLTHIVERPGHCRFWAADDSGLLPNMQGSGNDAAAQTVTCSACHGTVLLLRCALACCPIPPYHTPTPPPSPVLLLLLLL